MTHGQGDRWDDYRERIRQGPHGPEALYDGNWEPLRRLDEQFDVRDGEAASATVWLTRHGPVIAGDPETDDEVVATRWGLADAAHDVDAVIAMLRARNVDDAQAAVRKLDSVSGNFCVADGDGDIIYQYSGRIPKRPAWLVPVPGWDGRHEWDGNVPKEDLPTQRNPDTGYLLTANNRTTTPDDPHYLTFVATPFRADRLRELIHDAREVTPADAARWQSDQTSIPAREMAALFAKAQPATDAGRKLRGLLDGWDGHLSGDSPAGLALNAVIDLLRERTVRAFYAAAPELPPMLAAEERRALFDQLARDSPLMLPAGASWADEIVRAIDDAAASLVERCGNDAGAWRWDSAHWLQWRHNLGRGGDLAGALNIPPVPVGGDQNTPFAATHDHAGRVIAGVSYRQIFDFADLNAAQICIPPGNSGQPGSPHYADNVQRWHDVEYHPLFIDWDDIEANAEARMTLTVA
jgi:penicillin amidase